MERSLYSNTEPTCSNYRFSNPYSKLNCSNFVHLITKFLIFNSCDATNSHPKAICAYWGQRSNQQQSDEGAEHVITENYSKKTLYEHININVLVSLLIQKLQKEDIALRSSALKASQ